MCFGGSNSEIYYVNNLHSRLSLRFSTQGTSLQENIAVIFKERSISMMFSEATNYGFILLRKQGRTQLIFSGENKMIVG